MTLSEIILPCAVAGTLAVLVALGLALRGGLRELSELRRAGDGLSLVQVQLDALREQMRASLEGGRLELDRRLEETNRVVGEVRRGLGEVDRQVRTVGEAARDLRGLQELLRAPTLRGAVGETLLAELLAQMLPSEAFALQYAFPGGERVDAVIRVGGRLVPIDAKFPLDNFRREDRRAFAADVKRHVDAIASRYVRPGDGTFDFALMYLPAEAIYRELLDRDGRDNGADLLHYALTRRVVPVSPQSFYAYLQVIVLGLRGLAVEGRAREIIEHLGELRRRLDRFGDSFDVAARHLSNAHKQFDEASRRLSRVGDAVNALDAAPDAVTDAASDDAPDAVAAGVDTEERGPTDPAERVR